MTDESRSEYLSADELLNFDDIIEQDLEIPEWGNRKVRIRPLTLEQMADMATKATRRDPRGGPDLIDRELSVALTVIYGLVAPALSLDAISRLRTKNAGAITRIVQAINALGPTEDAIASATKSDAPERNGAVSIFPGARTQDDEG